MSSLLPSHASPIHFPRRAHQQLVTPYHLDDASTPPTTLLSPAFTPPATPGTGTPALLREPASVPVDTANDGLSIRPKLLETLPSIRCLVRARIPTVTGAEMFLHLYQNDVDDKEHLAIVFGGQVRSRSLDAIIPGESEMDRMIRGAYTGRLHPGRLSSRLDGRLEVDATKAERPARRDGLAREERLAGRDRSEVRETSKAREISEAREISGAKVRLGSRERSDEAEHQRKEPAVPPLVRIHSECYTGETAWSARCDCGEQLDEAARLMSLPSSSGGVIVYLRQEGRGIGLGEKLKAYNLQDLGSDTVEANLLLRHPADARSYGLATAILLDLGLGGDTGIRLLTNNPDKVRAIEGPNREVVVKERVAMVPLAWKTGGKRGIHSEEIEGYLRTKIGKMGHMIE